MERSPTQNAWSIIGAEQRILLALPVVPSTDAIASALALRDVLQGQKKEPTVVSHHFRLPDHHEFLPGHEHIESTINAAGHLVISVDVSKAKVEELSYDIHGDRLQIYLQPESGMITPHDVTATSGSPDHTLIITFDTTDLAALGPVFEENADFFYSTPIINIDHHSGNTGFGRVNIVDLSSSSTAEVVHQLLESHEPQHINERVATNILAGIIAKTRAFQSPLVTPRTLTIAGSCIARGAKREEIMRHLYQSRALTTLRLWGRVLARIQSDARGRYVWSRLRREDFLKSGDSEQSLASVLEELLHVTQKAEIAAVVYENENGQNAAVCAARPALDLQHVLQEFEPEVTQNRAFIVFTKEPLEASERRLREAIEKTHRNAQ
jgi:phosphoesterase RecJ-like protein